MATKNDLFKPMVGTYTRQSVYVTEGIDRQEQRIRKLADQRNLPVVRSFTDNDTSASKARGAQTGWGQLLEAIKAGEVNTVMAVDIDRLLRTPRDLLTLIDLDARILTVDGEIDLTTADGEFRAMMLAILARFEVRRKGERQKRANEHRANAGKAANHVWAPFGYTKDMTIVPEQAAAIRNGAEAYLAGASCSTIARTWNEAGLRTSQGGEFNRVAVSVVLKNPRIAGLSTYLKEVVAEGDWEAILPTETFNAVQEKFSAAKLDVKRPIHTGRHPLVGVAFCGTCGGRMRIGYKQGRHDSAGRDYRCINGDTSRNADMLEKYLSDVVVERLSQDDAHALLLTSDVQNIAELRDEDAKLRGKQKTLTDLFTSGDLPAEVLATNLATIRERLEVVAGLIERGTRGDILAPLIGARDVREAWEALDTDRKRMFFTRLLTVKVNKGRRGVKGFDPNLVEITWL